MRTFRFIALAMILGSASLVQADRLIFIPIGKQIAENTLRFEAFYQGGPERLQLGYLGFGIGHNFDAEIHTDHFAYGQGGTSIDLSYNIISPIADIAPGVSVGVQDLTSSSVDGRRFYLAYTQNTLMDNIEIQHHIYLQTTLGVYLGEHTSPFFGVSLPLGTNLRFLVEDNGLRLSAGVELKPLRNLYFRLISRDMQTYFTVGATIKI